MDLDLSVLQQKILLGKWVRVGVDWITDHFFEELRLFSEGLGWLIDGCVTVLLVLPPPLWNFSF